MKRALVSVIGSAGLVAGLMAGAPVVNAEEPSAPIAPSQLVSAAATPTQADADIYCSATPQPDADDTRAFVNQDDSRIICESIFTTIGSHTWSLPGGEFRLDALIVGGGASGAAGWLAASGSTPGYAGQGGGGGQVRVLQDLNVLANQTVTVGDGGSGKSGSNVGSVPPADRAENGQASAFGSEVATGGINNAAFNRTTQAAGGSANGSSVAKIGQNGEIGVEPSEGLFASWASNSGALATSFGAGGGGGSASNGTSGQQWTSGGTTGGGVGGGYDGGGFPSGGNGATLTPAGVGADGTGSGGGGGGYNVPKSLFQASADGGSGIVVVRYSPPSVPQAPTNVTGNPGDQQVTLSWTAPASDGGSAITDYTIEWFVNGVFDDSVATGSNATSYTVTNLVNLTAYTFKVLAENSVGLSAASAESSPLTPAAASAPSQVGAVRDDTKDQLTVSVTGAPPTGGFYRVQVSDDSGQTFAFGDDTYASSPITVTGLNADDTYVFRVAFTDASSVQVSPFTVQSGPAISPSATDSPTSVTAVMGSATGSVDVTVTQVGANDDSVIIQYTDDTVGLTGWQTVSGSPFPGTPPTVTVSGLTAGTAYVFQAATQPPTLDDTSNFRVMTGDPVIAKPESPATPLGVTMQPGPVAGSVIVSVDDSAPGPSDGVVTAYVFSFSDDSTTGWSADDTIDPASSPFTVTGLADDSVLYFRVSTWNAGGASTPKVSDDTVVVPSADAPAAGSVTVDRDDTANQLVVTVDDTLPTGKRFLVQVSDDSGVNWIAPGLDDTFTASPMFVSLSPAPAVDDTFVVRVAIADPDGTVVSAYTLQTGPAVSPSATDAPTLVTASMSTTTVDAVDVTVVQTGDDSVVIQYTDDTSANPIVWTSVSGGPFAGSAMPVQVTGLTGGTEYVFRAATQPSTFDDTSNWVVSNPAEARPGVPDDPAGLTATVGSGAGEVDLVVTAAGSGPAVAQYLVEWSADDSTQWATLGSTLTGSDDTQITLTGADGLVDDSVLYFRVYAVNSVDDSSALPAYDNTAIKVPAADAPATGSVAVSRDDTAAQLVVSVDDSLPVGKRFLVQVSDDSGVTWGAPTGDDTFTGSPMFVNVTETNADDTFLVRVAIANPDGTVISAYTVQTGEALSPSATNAPTSVTAVMGAGTGEVDVTVTQVASGDDSLIIQFTDDTVAPYEGWQTATGGPFTGTPSTLTLGTSNGLVAGTEYVFRAATQPATLDDTSNFRLMTGDPVLARPQVPGIPDASATTATAGDGSVYVTTAAGTGGTPTGFTVTAQGSGETCSITGASGYCVVSDLTNGTGYVFEVIAFNAGGSSNARLVTATPAAFTAPFPPVITSVVTGNGQIMVMVAETPGGGQLERFRVSDGQPSPITCNIVPPLDSCALTGLADGSFTISAVAIGGGGTSAATPEAVTLTSNATTPPDAPEVAGVTAGNQKLTVEVAAAQTGGSPTSYTVVGRGGSSSATCTVTSPATTCDLTGLTNGQAYTVEARAENAGGFSAFSNSENATPVNPNPGPAPAPPLPSKPSAPGSVKLDPGPARIGVSWTPATAPADAPVILYRATAIPGGASCQAAATATSCEISGLRDGTAYTVFVTAINGGGQGPAAQAGPVTPSSQAPARPGRPQVTAGNSQVNVTVVPGSGGGEAGSYTATASPGGASCTVAAPGVTCAITGLTNGTAYTVTTTATNGAGTSPVSPASASVTPNGALPEAPATPGRPTAVAGDSSATVTVTPGSGGGQADTFTVTANPGGASCTITAPDTSCEVTGLTNGTAYSFTAIATNAGGSSTPSAPSLQVTPQVEAPAPPKSVRVLVGDGQATITATPSDEGGPVEKFVVISTPGAKACVITLPETSCVIDGLTNGVAYTFAVRAVNAGGSTPAASPTAPVTPEPAIDPTPVPLVDPPAAGESQAVEDGEPVADLQVAPDRTGTGLSVSSTNFTLEVEGVDRSGNPVGLQNDQVLLLVDDGRARTQGTGFRPGSTVKLFLEVPVIGDGSMLRIGAAAAMDLGELRVDNLGEFLGTVNLPADLAPGDYVLQVAGVTQGNGERAVSLGVRVVDNNASITLVKGKRVKAKGRTDRIRATGTSEGIPAGTKLVPYFRLGKKGEFKQGVATIVVQEDGSFTWTRKVTRSRLLQAYVAFASAESNTVTWRRIR